MAELALVRITLFEISTGCPSMMTHGDLTVGVDLCLIALFLL
jgi:hypothetical protein